MAQDKLLYEVGRPKGLSKSTIKKCEKVNKIRLEKKVSIKTACKLVKISRPSYYKWLKLQEEN